MPDLTLLDNPIWHSLRGRHQPIAIGDERALRYLPDHSLLTAGADNSDAARAAIGALLLAGAPIGLVTAWQPGPVQAAALVRQVTIGQMVLQAPGFAPAPVGFEPLGDADAADMLALATLTAPGPYFINSHRLGRFIGIRQAGVLVAMAGERMKPHGFTEISAVCTHPDHRGRGFAAGLIHALIGDIRARGEGVFLHAYLDNPVMPLYEALGFRLRCGMHYSLFEPFTR